MNDKVFFSGLAYLSPATQTVVFNLCLNKKTLQIVRNLNIFEEARQKVEEVTKALGIYARGQVNEVYERKNFNDRRQHAGEFQKLFYQSEKPEHDM